jgi:hypothetical protein
MLHAVPLALHAGEFRLVGGKPRRGFENLQVLLAQAWLAQAQIELLSPAWQALGYRDNELNGARLCALIALPQADACAMVRLLLDTSVTCPVEFSLRCPRSERRFRWYRQFDPYTNSVFLLGDEHAAPPKAAAVTPSDYRSSTLGQLTSALRI